MLIKRTKKSGSIDFQSLVNENKWTMLLTTILVAGVALGTGSLHCLWGLVMLFNLNKLKIVGVMLKKKEDEK